MTQLPEPLPQVFTLEHEGRRIVFETPTETAFRRARSTLTKEPGTIAWIDSFAPGSAFWDIGANVGVFTLYAAVFREAAVLAVEPGASNYDLLNRNIARNGLDRSVKALCLALDRVDSVSHLNMQDQAAGGALHALGAPVDYQGRAFVPAFLQGSLGLKGDTLLRLGAPKPDYIKIDVDGLERAVVAGALEALRGCRSVLVELDLNDEAEVQEISGIMQSCGLARNDAVPGNRARMLEGARIYNMVFDRA